MGIGVPGTEGPCSQNREPWFPVRESLKKPHAQPRPRPDRQHLPLPRQGPDPGAARPGRAQARPDPAGRPPLRHRERPLRLRPGRAGLDVKSLFPDADAGRVAGRAQHPFRRCQPRPDHPPQRQGRGPGQSGDGRRPRRDRDLFRHGLRRPDQGPAKSAVERRPQLFGCRPQGRLHHQPRQRPRHREHGGRAGASPALPRQPLCRGLAGLVRVRPARPDAGDRRRPG